MPRAGSGFGPVLSSGTPAGPGRACIGQNRELAGPGRNVGPCSALARAITAVIRMPSWYQVPGHQMARRCTSVASRTSRKPLSGNVTF